MDSLGKKSDIGGIVPVPVRDRESDSNVMKVEIEICNNGSCTGLKQYLKLSTDGGARVVPASHDPGYIAITVGNVSGCIPNHIAVQLRDGLNGLNL